jgi:hypothetical protein
LDRLDAIRAAGPVYSYAIPLTKLNKRLFVSIGSSELPGYEIVDGRMVMIFFGLPEVQ